MSSREAGDHIDDILCAMLDVQEFTAGYSYDDFIEDRKTQYAVIRAIEIIGEASKNVPSSFKEAHRGISWREMATMRDRLIHSYFGVDLIIIWDTVCEDLPPFVPKIKALLGEID